MLAAEIGGRGPVPRRRYVPHRVAPVRRPAYGSARDALASHLGQSTFDRVTRHEDAAASRCFEQTDGDQRVAELMLAAQCEHQWPVSVVRCLDDDGVETPLASALTRTPLAASIIRACCSPRHIADNAARLVRQGADDHVHARLDDACLLKGDSLQPSRRATADDRIRRRDRASHRGDDVVASYRPPRPTSTTATSTRSRRNSSKAMAVVASKKVG